MIRDTCILSGCDYLPSLDGLGLRTALKLMKKYRSIERVIKMVRLETSTVLPEEYEKKFRFFLFFFFSSPFSFHFRDAKLTFLYQRVFDPIAGEVVYLNKLPLDFQEKEFMDDLYTLLGEYSQLYFLFLSFLFIITNNRPFPEGVGKGIAMCEIDPSTLKPFPVTNSIATPSRPSQILPRANSSLPPLKSQKSLTQFFQS